MNTDRFATIAGLVAAVAQLAHNSGFALGHIGSTDISGAIGSVALLVLGWLTNKKQVSAGAQAGVSRLQLLFMVVMAFTLFSILPAFAGVARYGAKHIVAPVAKATYHFGKKAAKFVGKAAY